MTLSTVSRIVHASEVYLAALNAPYFVGSQFF